MPVMRSLPAETRFMRRLCTFMLLLCLAALPPTSARATATTDPHGVDWPQFRGPNSDGRSSEVELFADWNDTSPLVERWRVPLGNGFSSVSIVDDYAVTLFGGDDGEYLAAFDTATGVERWRLRVGKPYPGDDLGGPGPRSTPMINAGRVFALTAQGVFLAADLATGSALWQLDLTEAYGGRTPTWGFAASAILVDGQLLIEAGGSDAGIVALDPDNGAELWRALGDHPAYSTPIVAEIHGQRQVIFFTAERALGIAPDGGEALWSVPWKTDFDINAATPIFVAPDKVLIASGYDMGGRLLRIPAAGTGAQVETVWHSRSLKNQFSSSVVVGDHVYGFDNSNLVCLDLETGERLWRARGFDHGSLLYADGHLVVLGEFGTLALVRAAPGEYQEVARQQVFDSKTWTPPSLSRHTLYVRDEHELVALELSPPS